MTSANPAWLLPQYAEETFIFARHRIFTASAQSASRNLRQSLVGRSSITALLTAYSATHRQAELAGAQVFAAFFSYQIHVFQADSKPRCGEVAARFDTDDVPRFKLSSPFQIDIRHFVASKADRMAAVMNQSFVSQRRMLSKHLVQG